MRGLHFQWNPFMGKLVRTFTGAWSISSSISGSARRPSGRSWPTTCRFRRAEYSEWIWVPPGFAHGNLFTEETLIEYFCTGEYRPGYEAAVSPLAADLDWSLCAPGLRAEFQSLLDEGAIISEKDRNAGSLSDWQNDPRSANFRYSELAGTGS